nr:MAG TPA: hypothetical protein [Caudoviricetes sp.]
MDSFRLIFITTKNPLTWNGFKIETIYFNVIVLTNNVNRANISLTQNLIQDFLKQCTFIIAHSEIKTSRKTY